MSNIRNQTWNCEGTLVRDIELYLDAGILKAKDILTDIVREPTEAEIAQFNYIPPKDLAAEIDEIKVKLIEKGIL